MNWRRNGKIGQPLQRQRDIQNREQRFKKIKDNLAPEETEKILPPKRKSNTET